MKYLYTLALLWCFSTGLAQQYHPQGTTIVKSGCDVHLILQIALETDVAADVRKIQSALDECFAIVCDLPCEDRRIGYCFVRSSVLVVRVDTLADSNKKKFHHVKMMPDSGVSYVAGLGQPNSGRSTSGVWYREEYSPKVYCHEALHLCGLDDHYRDCRSDRLHVNNCKDTIQCTPQQIANGECPPCPGYEDDCMGNDVTKPITCNENIMEVVRLVNDYRLACDDTCCSKTRLDDSFAMDPNRYTYGLTVSAGLGLYNFKNKDFSTDKYGTVGPSISLGGRIEVPIDSETKVQGGVGLNYSRTSHSQSFSNGPFMEEQKLQYQIIQLYIRAMIARTFFQHYLLSAGPEVGFILSSRSRYTGTRTFNGQAQSFGDDEFSAINEKRNIQLGLNLAVARQVILYRMAMQFFLSYHLPITNLMAFPNYRNKMHRIEIGGYVPLN